MKILITGTSQGIGKAIAQLFLEKEHTVYGIDRQGSSIDNPAYIHYTCDVCDYDNLPDIENVDILINNAGCADITPFLDTTDSDSASMLDINLKAHIDLTRMILPQMIKKQSGSIVNVSSVWGVVGASCEVLYSAAKAGVIGFTKALAKELAPSGITVNCVAPGCVESKMLDGLDKDELCSMIPLGKIANGLDVATAVMFLATHGYITGQTLSVDGGMAI